jgi:hypothetical protein
MASLTKHFLPIAAVLILALAGGCSRSISSASLEKSTRSPRSNMAPASLAGSQLKYRDNHGRNIYTFFSDGRYRFAWLSQNESLADSREGRFHYSTTKTNEALIRFENEPPITLRFTKPGLATGTIHGDLRIYQFQIVPENAK